MQYTKKSEKKTTSSPSPPSLSPHFPIPVSTVLLLLRDCRSGCSIGIGLDGDGEVSMQVEAVVQLVHPGDTREVLGW
jgi:hypothetical protein